MLDMWYIGYKDTYLDGEKVFLHVKEDADASWSINDYVTIYKATRLAPLFDQTLTLFAESQTAAERLLNAGFPYVINVSGYSSSSPLLIYFSENTYIKVYISGGHITQVYYLNGREVGGISSTASPATTPFSKARNTCKYSQSITALRNDKTFTCNGTYTSFAGQAINDFWNGVPSALKTSDPYVRVDPSGPGGGTGTGDFTSTDDIDFPGNPGVSAVNTGFVSLWSPTEQQMLNLSSYMWNADILTIEFWKRLWADPLDVIYGLNIIPVDLRATGRSIIGGTESVVVGLVNTGVKMDYLVEQWIELDCGSLSLSEVWGAYLDYDPYTKLEIYLPYCGIHPLRVDDFMSGTISLKYKIDLLSGACVAMIKSEKPNDSENDLSSVIYQFMGNCATQVPVTAGQYADAVRSVISLAASVGTMVAAGVGGAASAGATQAASKAALAERTINNGAAVVENVMGIKPGIERSGAIGASAGLLGVQTPYLIITRPRQARPTDQNKYTGYPSFITETLNDLEGWTIVKDIHLENIPCTADELTEIDGLLKSGVIF